MVDDLDLRKKKQLWNERFCDVWVYHTQIVSLKFLETKSEVEYPC